MARTRLLHPEFFTHEGLAALSAYHRILFAGLWSVADREGRLEDRPVRIHAAVFPYEDELKVGEMLDHLQRMGFLRRYEAGGKKYIALPSWRRWQNPHKAEKASEIPEPPPEDVRSTVLSTDLSMVPSPEKAVASRAVSNTVSDTDPVTVTATAVASSPDSLASVEFQRGMFAATLRDYRPSDKTRQRLEAYLSVLGTPRCVEAATEAVKAAQKREGRWPTLDYVLVVLSNLAPERPPVRDKQRDENEATRVLAQSLRELSSSLPEAQASALAADLAAADALPEWTEVQAQRAAVLAKWRKAAA